MSKDPRREPEDNPFAPPDIGERTSGVRRIPEPVAVPKEEESDVFFRFVAECERRRDFMFVEVFEELAAIRSDERKRRAEEGERRASYEEERVDVLNRLQQIAGVVRDHSTAMGSVVQGLERIQRCIRKVEDSVERVRQQQVSHGKELARVGSEVRQLSDHFEVAITHTRKVVHTNEERLEQVEHDIANIRQALTELSQVVDELCTLVKNEDPFRSRRPLFVKDTEPPIGSTEAAAPGPTDDETGQGTDPE